MYALKKTQKLEIEIEARDRELRQSKVEQQRIVIQMITAKRERERERVGEVKSVIKVALETHKKTSKN